MSGSAPWRRLRDLEPPLGARRRVLAEMERALAPAAAAPGRRGRWWTFAAATAIAVALVALAWRGWFWAGSERVAAEPGAEQSSESAGPAPPAAKPAGLEPDRALAAPKLPPQPPRVSTSAGDRMSLELAHGSVEVIGPASLLVGAERLEVDFGELAVDGQVVVAAPMCSARVSGRAEVEVTASAVDVAVFAGSVELDRATPACVVRRVAELDLSRASASAPAVSTRDDALAAGDAPVAVEDAPAAVEDAPERAAASALRIQVEQFRRARALAGRDREAALGAWRQFARAWPDSPLREEAEGMVVDLLVELDRPDQARVEAAKFLHRYPDSARAAAMRALCGEGER